MGEAKRRRDLGLPPRQTSRQPRDTSPRVVSWLPLTRQQARSFMTWTSRGAWGGIGLLVVVWLVVRFVGPALGWWTLQG
ncbi:DUF2839 domain-containing protein [Candidatus Synechococcus spongiarum]|uniref:DUF2839 domain-containing protein n=1 Tax=Candidatus Synechococcus spongiarum TaxID=431041 RepID=A0A164YXJ5_9SYNE|nr:DUF2839 domain-containing protein [Candidatus Synechococcus spongiarum]SAY39005.1 FIG01151604: hypothetical protein [Candidatus Synechococcus spongiarum]